MISLLINLLVLCIVAGVIYYILQLLPLPEPFKRIALLLFGLVVLLWVLAWVLPIGGGGHLLWRGP